ncbi:MAG: hypothetical protein J5892_02490 [Bacilli bacterium]|nr:hypothetical protein [Bacilli bacterium]
MSKKYKNEFACLITNRIFLDDAKALKKLLVFYLHQKTDNLSTEDKITFSKEHIFPLNKKIDLYNVADRLNNANLNNTYNRLRKVIIIPNDQNIDDYFELLSLIEILIILYQNNCSLDDDVLLELASLFVYETDISIDLINEYLKDSKNVLKPIR